MMGYPTQLRQASYSVYPVGEITLGNIRDILPFDDPTVVLELDGVALWDALETGLSKRVKGHPAVNLIPFSKSSFRNPGGSQLSRVCVFPGTLPGQRVVGIWLLHPLGVPATLRVQERPSSLTENSSKGRRLGACTRSSQENIWLQDTLLGHKYLIDDEHGQLMSSLVRKYLLGSHYVNKMIRLKNDKQETDHWHCDTADVVKREIDHRKRHTQKHNHWLKFAQRWHHTAANALHKLRSRAHYVDHINITAREHMNGVDCYNGKKIRQWSRGNGTNGHEKSNKEDLLVIHPVVDGRFKNVGRN